MTSLEPGDDLFNPIEPLRFPLHRQGDAIVACAVESEADYIVSGDQDLLVLGEFRGIEVVTLRRFVEIMFPSTTIRASGSPRAARG